MMTDALTAQIMHTVARGFADALAQTGETGVFLGKLGEAVPTGEQVTPTDVYLYIPKGEDEFERFVVTNPRGVGRKDQWVRCGKAPGSTLPVVLGAVEAFDMQFNQNETPTTKTIRPEDFHVGGDTPLDLDIKQIHNLGLSPYVLTDGSSPGLKLQVDKGLYRYGDKIYFLPTATRTGDLSGYVATTPGKALWLMVCLDPEAQTFSYVQGDEFTYTEDMADPETYIPQDIPANQHVAGFVLLPYGTTDFVEDDPYNYGWKLVRAHPAMTNVPIAISGLALQPTTIDETYTIPAGYQGIWIGGYTVEAGGSIDIEGEVYILEVP